MKTAPRPPFCNPHEIRKQPVLIHDPRTPYYPKPLLNKSYFDLKKECSECGCRVRDRNKSSDESMSDSKEASTTFPHFLHQTLQNSMLLNVSKQLKLVANAIFE